MTTSAAPVAKRPTAAASTSSTRMCSFARSRSRATSAVSKRIRPLLLEVATLAYKTMDAIAARVVMKREDLEDLLAEARARARGAMSAADARTVH